MKDLIVALASAFVVIIGALTTYLSNSTNKNSVKNSNLIENHGIRMEDLEEQIKRLEKMLLDLINGQDQIKLNQNSASKNKTKKDNSSL